MHGSGELLMERVQLHDNYGSGFGGAIAAVCAWVAQGPQDITRALLAKFSGSNRCWELLMEVPQCILSKLDDWRYSRQVRVRTLDSVVSLICQSLSLRGQSQRSPKSDAGVLR